MKSKTFAAMALFGLLAFPAHAATVVVSDDDSELLPKKTDLYFGIDFRGRSETLLAISSLVSGGFAKGLSSSALFSPHQNGSDNEPGAPASAHLPSSSMTLAMLHHDFRFGDGSDGSSDPSGSPSTGAPATNSDSVAATPLPAALPLFATGLIGIALVLWRRTRKGFRLVSAAIE